MYRKSKSETITITLTKSECDIISRVLTSVYMFSKFFLPIEIAEIDRVNDYFPLAEQWPEQQPVKRTGNVYSLNARRVQP